MEIIKSLWFGNQKAVVAFAVSGLLALLVRLGIDSHMTVQAAIETIVAAIVTGVSVWLKSNNED